MTRFRRIPNVIISTLIFMTKIYYFSTFIRRRYSKLISIKIDRREYFLKSKNCYFQNIRHKGEKFNATEDCFPCQIMRSNYLQLSATWTQGCPEDSNIGGVGWFLPTTLDLPTTPSLSNHPPYPASPPLENLFPALKIYILFFYFAANHLKHRKFEEGVHFWIGRGLQWGV